MIALNWKDSDPTAIIALFLKTHAEGGGCLFLDRDNPSRLSWGYILAETDRVAVCIPPHEDLMPVLEALGLPLG